MKKCGISLPLLIHVSVKPRLWTLKNLSNHWALIPHILGWIYSRLCSRNWPSLTLSRTSQIVPSSGKSKNWPSGRILRGASFFFQAACLAIESIDSHSKKSPKYHQAQPVFGTSPKKDRVLSGMRTGVLNSAHCLREKSWYKPSYSELYGRHFFSCPSPRRRLNVIATFYTDCTPSLKMQ